MNDLELLEFSNAIESDIKNHARNSKRSRQVKLGPSDISKPCARSLGYKILGVEPTNFPDPWFAIIGNAIHSWIQECYEAKNKSLGYPRYLIEKRVAIGKGISGKTDMYDTELKAIIDWKTTGDSGMKRAKAGNDTSYPEQLAQYAKGMIAKGYEVKHIITVYLPRNNFLSKKYITVTDYQPELAERALSRYASAQAIVKVFGAEGLAKLEAVEHHCDWCPFFLPGSLDIALGCPGAIEKQPQQNEESAA